jgi:hypothetical protein
MQIIRKMLPIFAIMVAYTCLQAQPGWNIPSPNSPELILGYMRFHIALADAITRDATDPSRNLSTAPRETLGVSLAEFQTLAGEYRIILMSAGAGPGDRSAASTSGHSYSTKVTSGFAAALSKISEGGASKVKAYVNGPFRASMRTRLVQGGVQ